MQVVKSLQGSSSVPPRSIAADALAALVMEQTAVAVKLISEVSFVDELLQKLEAYPGALERIILSDASPRWFKRAAEDALEEAGYVILT